MATGKLLIENKSPSRKVNELDNRGSHFYLALYWAQALAAQDKDQTLADTFSPVAQALADNELAIVEELNSVQGAPVDLDGYYRPAPDKCAASMRPSNTLNEIINNLS